MNVLIYIAFFSFVIAFITTALVPFAYFGDKNAKATKRLIMIAGIAGAIFMIAIIAIFW